MMPLSDQPPKPHATPCTRFTHKALVNKESTCPLLNQSCCTNFW